MSTPLPASARTQWRGVRRADARASGTPTRWPRSHPFRRRPRACTRTGRARSAKLVARAHQEREEPVEVFERVVKRRLQRLALFQPPMQITARALGVAITLERATQLLELATEHPGIRERAVVYEAPVLTRRVGMRILRRHRRLRRHSRVPDEMGARRLREVVTTRNIGRQAHILIEIDRAADAQHVHGRLIRAQPGPHVRR